MKQLLIFILIAAGTAPVFAQENSSPGKSPTETAATEKPNRTIEEWIAQLGDTSYSKRQAAEAALLNRGEEALSLLEEAAASDDDPEVRWRSRTLIGEIRRGTAASPLVRPPHSPGGFAPPWGDRDVETLFDSLFERLENEFGFDVPRQSFFHGPFIEDLREQMRAVRARLEKSPRRSTEMNTFSTGSSSSVSIQIGPNGVELAIEQTDENGKSETKKYTAPDVETFRELYPELAEEYLAGDRAHFEFRLRPRSIFGDSWFGGPGSSGFGSSDEFFDPLLRGDRAPRKGPSLGVLARPIGEELRSFLGLRSGHGLLVERVLEGSLAERLGIEPRDVILTIDGRPIGSASEVRTALEHVEKTVRVQVQRQGETLAFEASLEKD